MSEKHLMERAVQVNRLRIANGVPIVLSDGRMNAFPVSNNRVFTLENSADHPVYRRDYF